MRPTASSSRRETSEIPSEEEMRELAIDKGIIKFISRAQKVGSLPPNQSSKAPLSAKELFDKQNEELE
jgi:hypothetical protein